MKEFKMKFDPYQLELYFYNDDRALENKKAIIHLAY